MICRYGIASFFQYVMNIPLMCIPSFCSSKKWADPASRLLIASLISNTKESNSIFFACCYRDDDVREGDSFSVWLSSLNMFPLERMELRDISTDGANELVSETLHLFPRTTRPLASILHNKTRGNPVSSPNRHASSIIQLVNTQIL